MKLEDCRRHGLGSGAELFVVEGDSAAAAVERARDASNQAVLPMQGKPLNAAKASRAKVAAHPLFATLVDAVGGGLGETFDTSRRRYDRILLLMDPDADGIHCGLLMVMFFQRWMPGLLDGSTVHLVRPPWGEVVLSDEPVPRLAFSEPELQSLAASVRGDRAASVRRYRGLAGINSQVLAATCLAPATRRTSPVSAEDASAMIEIFSASPDSW
jgi:DNA gyrase subunit B